VKRHWQKLADKQHEIYERVVKIKVPFLAVYGRKFTKVCERVGILLWFPVPFCDCPYHVSSRIYWNRRKTTKLHSHQWCFTCIS